MDYTLHIAVDKDANELKEVLESSLPNEISSIPEVHLEVEMLKIPPRFVSGIDSGTVQVILGIMSGTGALAVALRGVLKVLEEYVKARKRAVKVAFGQNTIDISGNIPAAERRQLVEAFIQRCTAEKEGSHEPITDH